jgi:DNA-binding response OmpR family regulator
MNELALIIEDDPDLAAIFTEALQAADYQTETIRDGQEARQRLRQVVPKLVVLDMHLPNVSGRELLYLLRHDARLRKTLVMIVTADARMAETYGDQADYVLIKPVIFSQLRDLTRRLHGEALAE